MINTSDKLTSFSASLKTSTGFSYCEDDWLQYVMDHREWLYSRPDCVTHRLNRTARYRFRYNLSRLMKSAFNYPLWMVPVIRIVNRMGSDFDFTINTEQLVVPSQASISELRTQYNRQQIKLGSNMTKADKAQAAQTGATVVW